MSPDGGRVYAAGASASSGSNVDFATIAYDAATGSQIWAARYDNGPGAGWDGAASVAVSPNGARVFVTGRSVGTGTLDDFATVAYDAASGSQLWVARYNGPGNDWDQPYGVLVSPDGARVYVAGGSWGGPTSADFATVAYDAATGAQVWVARYDGPGTGWDQAYALALAPNGARLFATGWSPGAGGARDDYATVAYDTSTGAQAWVARYDGPGGLYDEASAIAVAPDGARVFVTGGSFGSGTAYDYGTVAYDAATGEQLWVARYDGPGSAWDEAHSIVATPDGARVFLTGQSIGSGTGWDFATVGYDAATGRQVWTARYDGPGSAWDEPAGLALSRDGSRLYVTGESLGIGSSFDFATVAYDLSSTCSSGANELGRASALAHGTVEPASGPAGPTAHEASCSVLVPAGL